MRATKLCNFPPCKESVHPIAQCFANCSGQDLLYLLYPHTIQVINFADGSSNEQAFDKQFRPIIASNALSEDNEPYFCFQDGKYGQFHNGSLVIEPDRINSDIFIVNNEFIISGDEKSGSVTFHNPSTTFTVNKPNFFSFKKLLNHDDGVMSIASNSKFLFILTKNGQIIIFRISDQRKLSSSTLCGEKLEFGQIKCDENNFYVLFRTRNLSVFQGTKCDQNSNQILFNIKHRNLKYFDINQEQIVLVSNDSVTIHNKETGDIQSNCILPFDLDSKETKITPEIAFLNSRGSVYISTKTEIYVTRPLLPLESHVLRLNPNKSDNQEAFDLLNASLDFCLRISRSDWTQFDSLLKTTSDPGDSAYELISKYFGENQNEAFESQSTKGQLNDLIDLLSMNDSVLNRSSQEYQNLQIVNDEFYRSVCSEIVFSYSYFCRCVYLVIMYLTYQKETSVYARQLRKLSMLVNIYTQLSILFTTNLPLGLFESFNPTYQENIEAFTQFIGHQLIKLLNLESTMKHLIQSGLYDTAVQLGSVSTFPLSYTGIALLNLGKYDEAVSFYIQNSQFLIKDREIAELVFESLRQARRDDLIIKIGYIDSTTNAAILFRAFLKLNDYDSAFNCILTTKDERMKCDMLRVFIRVMKDNKLHVKLLKSYPVNSLMSLFVNSLCTYSEETLFLAVIFFRIIGSRYQATQALYEYARSLLKTPTKERLGKAVTSLNLVLYQLDRQSDDISIRDMGSNMELKEKKVRRIISRTKCCLLLDDDTDTTKKVNKKSSISNSNNLTFGELLEIAADRNPEIFKTCLKSATDDELLGLVPILFEKSRNTPISLALNQLLSFNKPSKNPFIVEKLFTAYFHCNFDRVLIPPAFVVDRFAEINITRLFVVLAKPPISFNQNLLLDVLMRLKSKPNIDKLRYLTPLMKKMRLPDELISKFFNDTI